MRNNTQKEGQHRLPTEPCRLHRPKVRKGSHFVDGLTHLRHVASLHAVPELRKHGSPGEPGQPQQQNHPSDNLLRELSIQ